MLYVVGMTLRRALPLVALAGTIAVLLVPIAIGSAEARFGALFAMAGIAAGVGSAVRQLRLEYADDPAPPPTLHLLGDTLAGAGIAVVGLAVFFVMLLFGSIAPGSGPREDAGWPGLAFASVAGAALVVGLAGTGRAILRREGIERQNLLEATCIAFYVTFLFAGVYGSFEAMADAPRISMWNVWMVGGFTWAVAASVLHRRSA